MLAKKGEGMKGEPSSVSTWENYRSTFANPDKRQAEIFDAARKGDLIGFLSLQVTQEELEAKNDKGYTALMLSAYNGREDLTNILLGYGANPNSVDHSGNSILMGVSFKGNLQLAKILIQSGADLHYASPKGQTAVQMAVLFGRTDLVEYFESLTHSDSQEGEMNLKRSSSFRSFFRFAKAWAQYLFSFVFQNQLYKSKKEGGLR
ncbi:ankyrin repeat domain-containing protein [Leptospira ilyithenensis]|nr:ankyrin repeat domain-containing protein [Leptospira ilyithenensis]